MDFTKTKFDGSFDPIWRGECKVLPGGYAPEDAIPAGAIVRRGTPVEIDPEALTCRLGKSATVIEGGDTTNLRVAKGLLFVAGDKLTDGTTSATVSAVDTSASGYDVLSIDTAVEGSVVYSDIKPNGIACADYINDGLGIAAIDVAYEACLLYKGLAAPLADAWKDGLGLKGNPSIKCIVQ